MGENLQPWNRWWVCYEKLQLRSERIHPRLTNLALAAGNSTDFGITQLNWLLNDHCDLRHFTLPSNSPCQQASVVPLGFLLYCENNLSGITMPARHLWNPSEVM